MERRSRPAPPEVSLRGAEVLASSVGRTQRGSVTFEVSEELLEQARRGEWSDPVRFRFEEREAGRFDLVMRREKED